MLHVKLARLGKVLKKWSRSMVEEWKRRTEIAQEVVLRLDQAQERRPLTPGELSLRKRAKQRILGFAALRRIKIRQRSRLTWIREGDAITRIPSSSILELRRAGEKIISLLSEQRMAWSLHTTIKCNEHGTVYAISSDFGDCITTQSMGLMVLLSEYF